MTGLVLKDISKRFSDMLVLDDVSLELETGELLVLLGPSGCGKSTLLRIISGLETADSGEVHIEGRRVDHLRPRDRNVSLVFQNYSLYPHMTVRKNLSFPLRVAGVSKSKIESGVQNVAGMLDLGDRLNDRPGQLSGGQRQRVALGRAIIREPSIFLLDEPLSNLDAALRVRMRKEIVRIQKELGKTMVHVTHDQTEALTMADRIALLHDGRIEQLGTPGELYDRPASQWAASFVGIPKINLIDTHLLDGRLVPFGIIPTRDITAKLSSDGCVLGLRPEAIKLSGDGEYEGRIESCEYMGDHYVVELSFQSHHLTMSNMVTTPPNEGSTVRFDIDTESLLFFDTVSGHNLQI